MTRARVEGRILEDISIKSRVIIVKRKKRKEKKRNQLTRRRSFGRGFCS
jgi:hypothetical protein